MFIKRTIMALSLLSLLLAACAAQPQLASEPDFFPGGGEEAPAPVEAITEREAVSFAADKSAGLPEAAERLVIKNADISVVVDDPGEALNQIARMAEEMGGFVVSSNLYMTTLESGAQVPRASITIRVPAERFIEALDQIETGANQVLGRNESGQDVTQEYTDLQSRLRNLEDAEAQLREIMDSATKTEDVISVFNQLTQIREQIEVTKGRIQFFEQSAAFSAISVDLIANEAVQPLTIGSWQPVGVAKDALQFLINTLKGLANFAIWLVLAIIPIAVVVLIPLALLWRGFRRWRSRRKKASPPPTPPEG